MKKEHGPLPTISCSPLLPPDIAEIFESATRPLSRKKFKQLEKQRASKSIPLLAAMSNVVADSVLHSPPKHGHSGHREKIEEHGDRMNPLIA